MFFKFVSPWLFSPFLLFYGFLYFGGALTGEARGIGNAFRGRQNFKRFLHNATVNPRDADARVQLGLIYLQRQQREKALQYFTEAVEIDKNEIDGNYELGKLARKKRRFTKGIKLFFGRRRTKRQTRLERNLARNRRDLSGSKYAHGSA